MHVTYVDCIYHMDTNTTFVTTNISWLDTNSNVSGTTPVDDPADEYTDYPEGVNFLYNIPKNECSRATTKYCKCTTTYVSFKNASMRAKLFKCENAIVCHETACFSYVSIETCVFQTKFQKKEMFSFSL